MKNARHYIPVNEPVMTQTLDEMNRTLATPLTPTLTEVFDELFPGVNAVKPVQLIVNDVFVLLNNDTASPDENVLVGIVIIPFAFDCSTNLPTSTVDSVYAAVFCPTGGMFMKPRVEVVFGKVN
jgi:hypothetical protein